MNDREPFFRLVPGPDHEGEVTPEMQAYFDSVAQALNHALEVTYREEFELTKAEFTEAMMDHLVYGGPMPDVEKIAGPGSRPSHLSYRLAPRVLQGHRMRSLTRTWPLASCGPSG
jgi:hypothetical protein